MDTAHSKTLDDEDSHENSHNVERVMDLKSIRAAISRVEAEARATVAAESRAFAQARARAVAEDRAELDNQAL